MGIFLAAGQWIACDSSEPNLFEEPCDTATMNFIDHAIEEALFVEPYVEDALSLEFEGDFPSYATVLDKLIEVRSGDRIYCGSINEEGPYADLQAYGWVMREDDGFALNFDDSELVTSFELWEENHSYGDHDLDDIPAIVAGMDIEEFGEFKDSAYHYLTSPALVVHGVAHETAHLVEDDCCHHAGQTDPEQYEDDYVVQVGEFAEDGVFWMRWRPEVLWLDQLFAASH